MSEAPRTSRSSDRPGGRSSGPSRRGHDVHQTHFFDAATLRAGAVVVDHVTGEQVGTVDAVGRHVFEGYGAPGRRGGPAGDLVVEVRELDPVVPVRLPPSAAPTPEPAAAASTPGAPPATEGDDDGTEPPRVEKAAVAQGVAIAVLAPVLALALLVLVLVLVLS
ncbi:hypothetical protein SAMN04488570_3506 [Nocardioides scoriae]|uniref:Uncharacterized protein n=1 Tax=Nocardioides scoriae TaxID=642780 RepID=A0A1H1XJL1_9ACTN|nr:hypothetical protein [Nocardioides scoriae]SDT09333.1 hypothetical protein SAMN04488570_3506 [Nocardioides scoriae]